MHVCRKLTFILAVCLSFILSLNSIASTDIIGYSGRLVQTNGTPVTGTVDLRFEVFNSTGPSLLETIDENSVTLTNGIYTVQLTIPNLQTHIENLSGSETLLIRVSDITDLGNIVTYEYQSILSVPLAYYANKAATAESIADDAITPDSLDFVATCNDNQILIKIGNQFDCINQTAALTVDSTLVNNAGVLGQATFGTPGTYTSVTVDSYGRVSSGSTTVGSSEITDGSITNDDVSATAAIAWSKIAYPTIDKTYVGLGNVIDTAQIPASDLDNSGTLDSATQVPSELAVKGYVDTYADAKVIDDMTGTETTTAPSVNSVKNYVTAQTGSITSSQWTTAGSDIHYNSGNVGIGTSTPNQKLVVGDDIGSISANNAFVIGASGTSNTQMFMGNDGNNFGNLIWNGTDRDLVLRTKNAGTLNNDQLVLDSSSNVGVGIAAPTEKLEVAGNTKATGFCIGTDCITSWPTGNAGTVTSVTGGTGLTGGTITSTGTLAVDVGTTDGKIAQIGTGDKLADSIINYNPAIDVALTGFTAGTASTVLATDTILQAFGKVQAQINAQATLVAGLTSDDITEGSTNLYFNNTRAQTAAVVNSTAGSETTQAASVSAMKSYVTAQTGAITSSQWTTTGSDVYYNTGNVGIGTTTPAGKLHTVSTAISEVPLDERQSTSTGVLLTTKILKAKTSADMVDGFGSSFRMHIEDSAGVDNPIAFFGALRDGADNSGALTFATYNAGTASEKMRVDSTGNVGIGTTGPNYKLHIRETGAGQGVFVDDNSSEDNETNGAFYSDLDGFSGTKKVSYISDIQYSSLGRNNYHFLAEDPWASRTLANNDPLFYVYGPGNLYAAGNVGIGTTTPTQKLTVDGGMNVTTGNDICIDGTGCLSTVVAASGEPNTASSAGGASLVLAKSGTDLPFKGLTATSDIALTENASDIQIGVNTSNGANELLRLDGSGRVPSSVVDVTTVLNTPLTGYTVGTNSVLAATDTVLDAYGKLQAQINANYTAITGLDTDDVAEGTNLYFTNTRAQTAAVVNSTAGSETTQAPSVSAIKTYVDARSTQWTTTGSNIYYSTGNVGIGTTTPTAKLDIIGSHVGSGHYDNIIINQNGSSTNEHSSIAMLKGSGDISARMTFGEGADNMGYLSFEVDDTYGGAGTTTTEVARFHKGKMGIGTTTPSEKLHVNGNLAVTGDLKMVGADSYIWTNGTGTGYTGIWDQANGQVLLYTGESSGNVGIGTTTPSEKLHVAGNVLAAAYLYTSDERFKENVETIIDPLHKVNSLRGVTFDWRTDEFPERNFPQEKTVGFIAQEVEKVQPELVKTSEDGYKSVQYGNITALLVEAVKSLSDKVNELFSNDKEVKREIASLKEENEQLKAEMQEMRAAIKELQKANKK